MKRKIDHKAEFDDTVPCRMSDKMERELLEWHQAQPDYLETHAKYLAECELEEAEDKSMLEWQADLSKGPRFFYENGLQIHREFVEEPLLSSHLKEFEAINKTFFLEDSYIPNIVGRQFYFDFINQKKITLNTIMDYSEKRKSGMKEFVFTLQTLRSWKIK
jgi:hypothetical protein